jgi:hypothetical protein
MGLARVHELGTFQIRLVTDRAFEGVRVLNSVSVRALGLHRASRASLRSNGVGNVQRSRNVIAAVAVSVLAILPTRQVTVPADIVGLTRIDFILGAAVTLGAVAIMVAPAGELLTRGASKARKSGNRSLRRTGLPGPS